MKTTLKYNKKNNTLKVSSEKIYFNSNGTYTETKKNTYSLKKIDDENIKEIIYMTYEDGTRYNINFLEEFVIPTILKIKNKEVKTIEETNDKRFCTIYQVKENKKLKRSLEAVFNIKLTGIQYKDKEILQGLL